MIYKCSTFKFSNRTKAMRILFVLYYYHDTLGNFRGNPSFFGSKFMHLKSGHADLDVCTMTNVCMYIVHTYIV